MTTLTLVAALSLITIVILGIWIFSLRSDLANARHVVDRQSKAIQRHSVILYQYRDTWDHLSRSLPVSKERRQVACGFGRLSVLYCHLGDDLMRHELDWLKSLKESDDPLVLAAVAEAAREEPDLEKLMDVPRTILFQSFNPNFNPDEILQDDGPMTLVVGPREDYDRKMMW